MLIEATLSNKEISAEEIKRIHANALRDEQLNQLLSTTARLETRTKENTQKIKTEKKSPAEKTLKPDTKEETYKLYQAGNSIEEIAKLRSLVSSTIETHLAYYVTKGKIPANAFVNEEKMASITTVLKTLNTLQLSSIKSALGDEFSYSDIRFAVAGYLAMEDTQANVA